MPLVLQTLYLLSVVTFFNAPDVGVIASRNILESDATMNAVRIAGMALSALRHPQQMGRDILNGLNLCKVLIFVCNMTPSF